MQNIQSLHTWHKIFFKNGQQITSIAFSLNNPQLNFSRWNLKLEEYNYDIEYVKGKTNYVADTLSRIKTREINIYEKRKKKENIEDAT